jgi:hypothetical protein
MDRNDDRILIVPCTLGMHSHTAKPGREGPVKTVRMPLVPLLLLEMKSAIRGKLTWGTA